MPVPDIEAVRQVLGPLHADLRGIVSQAWALWLRSRENMDYQYGRTRACIVWEHLVRLAEARFSEHANIVPLRRHETVGWLVAGFLHFRFKKGNQQGLSSNVSTQLALALHDHEQALPGIPAAVRVEVVYVLNELETEIQEVLVVCRDRNQVAWSYSISASEATVVPFPTTPRPKTRPALFALRQPELEGKQDEQDPT